MVDISKKVILPIKKPLFIFVEPFRVGKTSIYIYEYRSRFRECYYNVSSYSREKMWLLVCIEHGFHLNIRIQACIQVGENICSFGDNYFIYNVHFL